MCAASPTNELSRVRTTDACARPLQDGCGRCDKGHGTEAALAHHQGWPEGWRRLDQAHERGVHGAHTGFWPTATTSAPALSSHTSAARLRPQYQKVNKEAGNEWFAIESNKTGTRWTGKVWCMHGMRKYEFDLEFELPVAYPSVRSWRSATSPRTAGTDLCSHHIYVSTSNCVAGM